MACNIPESGKSAIRQSDQVLWGCNRGSFSNKKSSVGLSAETEANDHTDQGTATMAIEKDCLCNTEDTAEEVE